MANDTLKQAITMAIAISTAVATVEADGPIPSDKTPTVLISTQQEPIAAGTFGPTWESLANYQAPDWFRDAKFGIWAHWGPQCEPEDGDWYARNMYIPGQRQYKSHVARYGHPSQFGFKDVIRAWKAEKFDPEDLLKLYKRAGAQYFFALANHHDNLDLWDSKYQPWNSTKVGPQRDLISAWSKATREAGLKFGVSVHAAHAWSWYEVAQGADKDGPNAGKPFDGKLTKADGNGTWWEGLDPQDLYAQSHTPGKKLEWSWDPAKGSSTPDQAYCQKFYDRTMDLINQAKPDLVYFDDTVLPLWPVSDAGLKLAAHLYNSKPGADGKTQAVLFGKILDPQQRECMVWDIERGQSDKIEPQPWQTDTCLGGWHYERSIYDQNRYKSAATVVRTLADVVSKNGNLLLSVPVRADGTIDEKERAIVEGIAEWMQINGQAIFGTRPWQVCGEGPQLANQAPLSAQGFNEGKGKPATAEDVRYTAKGDTLYAITLATPEKPFVLGELATSKQRLTKKVKSVSQLGSGDVEWKLIEQGLSITPKPATLKDTHLPVAFQIELVD